MNSYKYTLNKHGVRIDAYIGSEKSVYIPSHINDHVVTEIGKNAFYKCFNVTDVYLPDTLIEIGESAFYDCVNLKSVTIPESLISIGKFAFWDCFSLIRITLPKNIENFDASALLGCEGLQEIIVAESNLKFVSVDGVLFTKDKTKIIRFPSAIIGEFVIPEGVKYIEDGAFDSCEELTKITLPESLVMIFPGAFRNCKKLKSLVLYGDSINQIHIAGYNMTDEFGIFENCELFDEIQIHPSLSKGLDYNHNEFQNEMLIFDLLGGLKNLIKLIVHEDHELYRSIDGMLFSKDITALLFCPHKKSGVVTIPDSVKLVWGSAFCGCAEITRISLPEGVTTIDDCAYEGCLALEELRIPSSVANIDLSAFNGCNSLMKITVDDLNPDYSSKAGVLYNKERSKILLVPYGFAGSFTIPPEVIEIDDQAFDECIYITDIHLPDGVTFIGFRAFCDCVNLCNINIPLSVAAIGIEAFDNCQKLESISVDAMNGFYVSLDGILFNKEKTELVRCPIGKIGSVTLPEEVLIIHAAAFRGCQKLSWVSIPSSVTSIGKGAFEGCTGLDQKNVSEIMNRFGEEVFTTATS